jgi:uncharacterized protein (DUF3084 family)
LHLTKSQIAERWAEARQIARNAKLEGVNSQLRAELDSARSKLAEVEGRKQALTSKNKGLKKDLQDARTTHDVVVKDRVEALKNECAKLQQF